MDSSLVFLNVFISLLFIILGYLVKYKKKYNLIAGFSDYDKEKNNLKEYNMKKIGNVVGNSLFIYALSLILLTIFQINYIWMHPISLVAMFGYTLIFCRNIKTK